MRRRSFVLGAAAAAAWPIPARPQQAIPVIAYMNARSQEASAGEDAAFRAGLADAGYVVGRNVAIEAHYLAGRYKTAPDVAHDLVGRAPAIIFAGGGTPSVRAAEAATSKIPIVFATGSDPVADGLVKSLRSPGGNVTGVALQVSAIYTKMLALLHELAPHAVNIAFFANPRFGLGGRDLEAYETAQRSLDLHTEVVEAATPDEIDAAFARLERQKPDALLVAPEPFLNSRARQIAALAAHLGVPAVYGVRDYAAAGGLMSYGSNFEDAYRQAGRYAGKVLGGTKPADLPVILSSTFQLVINLKTAKGLGLAVPPTLLARADEVIE